MVISLLDNGSFDYRNVVNKLNSCIIEILTLNA